MEVTSIGIFFTLDCIVLVNQDIGNIYNPLSAKSIKWPNTLKQFVSNLPTYCLSVSGHTCKRYTDKHVELLLLYLFIL